MGTFDAAACKREMMHSLLFVNNQLPTGGCYNLTWSLAVQMQFYFFFPLALMALRPQVSGFR